MENLSILISTSLPREFPLWLTHTIILNRLKVKRQLNWSKSLNSKNKKKGLKGSFQSFLCNQSSDEGSTTNQIDITEELGCHRIFKCFLVRGEDRLKKWAR